MRRMNYNPFGTPFASGEYDKSQNIFVIDKPLEYGNLYIAQIYNTDNNELSTAIFDLTRQSNIVIASIHITDSTENFEPFYMFVEKSSPTHINIGSDQAQSITNNFVIYIYKVF